MSGDLDKLDKALEKAFEAATDAVRAKLQRQQAEIDGLRSFRDRDLPFWKSKFSEARREIRRLRIDRDAWKQLVNDAERAIGMESVSVSPEARSLVEWCDEIRAEIELLKRSVQQLKNEMSAGWAARAEVEK